MAWIQKKIEYLNKKKVEQQDDEAKNRVNFLTYSRITALQQGFRCVSDQIYFNFFISSDSFNHLCAPHLLSYHFEFTLYYLDTSFFPISVHYFCAHHFSPCHFIISVHTIFSQIFSLLLCTQFILMSLY